MPRGNATARTVSCRLPTSAVLTQSQMSSCGIHCEHESGKSVVQVLVFPLQFPVERTGVTVNNSNNVFSCHVVINDSS
jgi:hypothetical protein